MKESSEAGGFTAFLLGDQRCAKAISSNKSEPRAAWSWDKRGLRLRRPMRGRAVPFRQELMESGATPQTGA